MFNSVSSLISAYGMYKHSSKDSEIVTGINKNINIAKTISNMKPFDYNMLARVFKFNSNLDATDNYDSIISIIKELGIDNNSDTVYLDNIAHLIQIILMYKINVNSDDLNHFVLNDNIMLKFMTQYDVCKISDFSYSFNRTYGKDVFKKMLSYKNPVDLNITDSEMNYLHHVLVEDEVYEKYLYLKYVFNETCNLVNIESDASLKLAYYMAKIAIWFASRDSDDKNVFFDNVDTLIKGINDGYPDEYLIEIANI